MAGEDEIGSDAGEVPSSGEQPSVRALKPGDAFGNHRVIRCLADGLLASYYQM